MFGLNRRALCAPPPSPRILTHKVILRSEAGAGGGRRATCCERRGHGLPESQEQPPRPPPLQV